MSYTITDIEGIGPASADKLAAAQIKTTDDLLTKCATKNGRAEVAEQTGISEGQLLTWSNMADLMRISGVGGQYAELLKATGVDTVKELRNRNAANLADAMNKINEEKKLTKASASTGQVEGWIDQAKKLDPRITH